MKKIGFITTNKVLAQSLAAVISSRSDVNFNLLMLLNPCQAVLDASVLKIDAAMVDIPDNETAEDMIPFCKNMKREIPDCKLLLFLPQNVETKRKVAEKAVQEHIIDDFIFYDTSLTYLIAKLSAI